MKKKSNNQFGLDTLIQMSNDLQEPFTISYTHKHYSFKIRSCTVKMFGKSFTAKSDGDIVFEAIKLCVIYAVKTFSIYEEQRKLIKEEKPKCEPCDTNESGNIKL